jgi:drug/metabolite transporter (DMT)-like permease
MTEIRSSALPRNATLIGIGLALFSVFLFTINNALGKLMVSTLPVGEFLFLRAFGSLLLLSPFCWRIGWQSFRAAQRPALQLLRVVFSVLEILAFYWAVTRLPLADALTFWLAAPIYVTALSAVLLGEKVGWRRWTAVLIGFAGVIVVMRPSAASVTWPALLGVVGGFFFALQLITTRSLRATPEVVLLTINVVAVVIAGLVTLPFAFIMPSPSALMILAVMAVFSVVGSLYFVRALKLAPASVVAPYKNTMIIWGVVFGYYLFGDIPDAATVAGAVIIIGASLYIFLREQKLGKQTIADPPDA